MKLKNLFMSLVLLAVTVFGQTFPAYVVAPTPAAFATGAPISPLELSTPVQAASLLATLNSLAGFPMGATIVPQTTANGTPSGTAINWNGETRCWCVITFPGGSTLNVGLLLGSEYVNGVGSPGYWSITTNGGSAMSPVWVSTVPGPTTPSAPVIPPGQPLSGPTESIGGFIVPVPPAAASPGVGLTAAQAASLAHIESILVRVFGN